MPLSWKRSSMSTTTWSAGGRRGRRQAGPRGSEPLQRGGSRGKGRPGTAPLPARVLVRPQRPTGHRAQNLSRPGQGPADVRLTPQARGPPSDGGSGVSPQGSGPSGALSPRGSWQSGAGHLPGPRPSQQTPGPGPGGSGDKGWAPALAHFHGPPRRGGGGRGRGGEYKGAQPRRLWVPSLHLSLYPLGTGSRGVNGRGK